MINMLGNVLYLLKSQGVICYALWDHFNLYFIVTEGKAFYQNLKIKKLWD